MPGYVSHIVMAKDVYRKLKDGSANLEYMLTYSLGGDLCKYAKCRHDSHYKDMDKFIYNMASYIKMNNLVDDSECLGVLYAHICHYVMDDTIHPLVRKMSKVCIKNNKNHTWIEQYYNKYLTNKIFNLGLDNYVKSKILSARMPKKIAMMIDYAYLETYNTNNVSKYYRFNLFLYRLERIIMIINSKLWYKINGLDRFIKINQDINLVNSDKKIEYINNLGKVCNDDLFSLYKNSLNNASLYIKKINKYLNN